MAKKRKKLTEKSGHRKFTTSFYDLEKDIEKLVISLPLLNTVLETAISRQNKKDVPSVLKKLKKFKKNKKNNIVATLEDLLKSLKNISCLMESPQLVMDSYLVMLDAKFDNFLAVLANRIFNEKPELLNIKEKSIPYSEISNISTVEDIKNYIIDKEVDDGLRGSREDQLSYLGMKTNINLAESLPNWPEFVEICERRNIIIHTGGKVSKQYVNICKKNKCLDENVKLGEKLTITDQYLNRSFDIFLEIGLCIFQKIYRKLMPEDYKIADKIFLDTIVSLILKNKYEQAIKLLDYALSSIKTFKEDVELMIVINKALANKLMGRKDECLSILKSKDWTAKEDIFKMAVCILEEKYDKASEYMIRIGDKSERIRQEDYQKWPIFVEFRKSKEFPRAYLKTFNTRYRPSEQVSNATEQLIERLNLIKKER
jgi:hypothetical protein